MTHVIFFLFSAIFNYLVLDNTKYRAYYNSEVRCMNTQFKKGVLELIVLLSVNKKDMYGYELVSEVSKVVDVNEGTIYPLLKRLTNEKYFETYLEESKEGPPRKYYHLTVLGRRYQKELLREWSTFCKQVNEFIKESEEYDEAAVY